MKVLLISDVHANIDALNAVDEKEKNYDEVWFAGDALEYGFFPHECLQWLKDRNAKGVLGNHDENVIAHLDDENIPYDDPFKATDFTHFTIASITHEDKEYLLNMPKSLKWEAFGKTYFMEHIYRNDPSNSLNLYSDLGSYNIVNSLDEYWSQAVGECTGEKCYIIGDSHQCLAIQPAPGRFILNPGSVSYRLGPDTPIKGIDYMVIEDGIPFFRQAFCDTNCVCDMIEKTNFNEQQKTVAHSLFPKYDYNGQ